MVRWPTNGYGSYFVHIIRDSRDLFDGPTEQALWWCTVTGSQRHGSTIQLNTVSYDKIRYGISKKAPFSSASDGRTVRSLKPLTVAELDITRGKCLTL